jgi:uncharacterized RDD family membrane protein YckC
VSFPVGLIRARRQKKDQSVRLSQVTIEADNPRAGLLRRAAALTYDALLVISILMMVTLAVVALRGGEPVRPGNLLYQALLIIATGAFFIGFWVYDGQTLGMRAWRIRVERASGDPLDWKAGLIRFAAGVLSTAAGGLGWLWALIDSEGRTWHDRIAGTRVVLLPKKK